MRCRTSYLEQTHPSQSPSGATDNQQNEGRLLLLCQIYFKSGPSSELRDADFVRQIVMRVWVQQREKSRRMTQLLRTILILSMMTFAEIRLKGLLITYTNNICRLLPAIQLRGNSKCGENQESHPLAAKLFRTSSWVLATSCRC